MMVLKMIDYLLIILILNQPIISIASIRLLPFKINEHSRALRCLYPPRPFRHNLLDNWVVISEPKVVFVALKVLHALTFLKCGIPPPSSYL